MSFVPIFAFPVLIGHKPNIGGIQTRSIHEEEPVYRQNIMHRHMQSSYCSQYTTPSDCRSH